MPSNAEVIKTAFKQVMGAECTADLSAYEQLSEVDLMAKLPEIIDDLRHNYFATPEWYRALCNEYRDAYRREWTTDVETTRDLIKLPSHGVINYITSQMDHLLRDMHQLVEKHSV